MAEKSLKSNFSAFAEAAVQTLLHEPVPLINERQCQLPQQERMKLTTVQKPGYEVTINDNKIVLEDLNAFDECVTALRSNASVVQHHSVDDLSGILRQFLADLLHTSDGSSPSWNYDSDRFNTLYEEYKQWLLSDTLPRKRFVTLQGLRHDTDSLHLDNYCQIRQVTEQVLTSIVQSGAANGNLPEEWNPMYTGFFLEVKCEEQKADPDVEGTVSEELDVWRQKIADTVTALRLTHDGEVGYSREYTYHAAPWEQFCGSRTEANFFPLFRYGSLVIDDESEIQRVYDMLNEKPHSAREPDVAMSVERFNSSYRRENERVQFSDLMIILEALVSKSSNISRAMQAQRVAILLGENIDARKEIFETYRDLYDERSGVWGVGHGGGSTTLSSASLDTAQGYVKRLLIKILEHESAFGGHGEFIKQLKMEIERSYLDVEFP